MGLRRAGVALFVLVLVAALLPLSGRAQTAEEERDRAYSLLSRAVANRDQVELELALAMEEYLRVANELAAKAASADRLAVRVESTRSELSIFGRLAEQQAVVAYMEALTSPSDVMLRSDSLEEALVLRPLLEILFGQTASQSRALEVTQRDLDNLQARLATEIIAVQGLQQEAKAAADNLAELFGDADARVGLAIQGAVAADLAYRAELDRIETAQAEAAEQARQQERSTTTVAPAAVAGSSTTSTTLAPPSIGDRPLKPAVERWRSLVGAYFPATRVEAALRIIQCESLGDPEAYNPYSGASGLFQFLPGTYAVIAPKAGFDGVSVFDPEANIGSAAWLVAYYESLGRNPWTPWHCTP